MSEVIDIKNFKVTCKVIEKQTVYIKFHFQLRYLPFHHQFHTIYVSRVSYNLLKRGNKFQELPLIKHNNFILVFWGTLKPQKTISYSKLHSIIKKGVTTL